MIYLKSVFKTFVIHIVNHSIFNLVLFLFSFTRHFCPLEVKVARIIVREMEEALLFVRLVGFGSSIALSRGKLTRKNEKYLENMSRFLNTKTGLNNSS